MLFPLLPLQENSKKLKMKFPTKIPNRKTKCKSTKTPNSNNLNESLDILRLDPAISLQDTKVPPYQRAAAGKKTSSQGDLSAVLSSV